jgi:hypothetical protein
LLGVILDIIIFFIGFTVAVESLAATPRASLHVAAFNV